MFEIKIEFTKYGCQSELLVHLFGDIPQHDHDLRESVKRFIYPVLMDRFLHPQLPDEELNDKTWIELKLNNQIAVVLDLQFRNFRIASYNSKRDLNERWRGWETEFINEAINEIETQIARYEAS